MNIKAVVFLIGIGVGFLFSSLYFLNILNGQKSTIELLSSQIPATESKPSQVSMGSLMKEYSDLDYLNLMIIHNQDSVELAKRSLVNSTNDYIRNFASSVITTQTKQINDMKIEIDKIINQTK